MSERSSPLEGPNMLTILRGAVDAVWAFPAILGLFLLSGILRVVLPTFVANVVRPLFIVIGVVIAYRALDGQRQIHTASTFVLRLFMALLAVFASYLLFVVGVLALILPGIYGWAGFFVFLPPSAYVYTRLFLSTPAAMIDGHGPAEALAGSWRLMRGSVLATGFALLIVLLGGIAALFPVFWFVQSDPLLNIGVVLIIDTLLAGMQAFLYITLTETSEATINDGTESDPQEITSQNSVTEHPAETH
ncbi:hypothetical protein [Halocatena marina]|uniref:hypothetical protein n=1 Tax=Halocatena marina TaxID=2934937 RepID=UPI00200D9D3B|nr:hypothetical protein [Halocatena marina]